MAQYFIKHPLQAVVGAILLTLLGILAAVQLPVEEYPNMNQPTVNVTTEYPGADAQVLQDTVANNNAAIEQITKQGFLININW